MEVKFHAFLTMEVHVGENLASQSSRFTHTRGRLVHDLSTRSSRVNMLHATQCYVNCGEIWNEKKGTPSPDNEELEPRSTFENILAVYLRTLALHY